MKTFSKSSITLKIPKDPKILVSCDVDETYIPFKEDDINNSGIKKLENYILKNYLKRGIIICWITGSNIKKFKKKLKYINVKPHFIASDLGSELYKVNKNNLSKEKLWYDKINKNKFIQNFKITIKKLKKKNKLEKESYGNMRKSFYLIKKNKYQNITSLKKFLNNLKKNKKLNFNLSKSSVAAGDPIDSHDLDFIPINCGKREAFKFIKNKYSIKYRNTVSFGDSFNDFEILNSSKYSFIVGNASKVVKNSKLLRKKIILKKNYCNGILEGFKILEKKIRL